MLNRHNFDIAVLAPKDEERLTMCGILVSPEGTAVTDGHMAVKITASSEIQPSLFAEQQDVIPADFFSPFILDRETALRIAKSVPKKNGDEQAVHPIIDATTENNDRAMVSINDIFRQEIIRAKKISGTFPDIEKVMPSKESARFVLLMNPDLLVDVLKSVQKFCNGRETGSIELRLYGVGQPLRIDVDGLGQSLSAVIMPMRSEAEPV